MTSIRPLDHVVMTVAIATATSNGSQPPCSTLAMFAEKNASSTEPKTSRKSATCQGRHRNAAKAYSENRQLVSSRSSVTATP